MVQFCGGRSAPIVKPSEAGWSKPALEKYLGPDPADWRQYDTCLLLEDGHRFDHSYNFISSFMDEHLRWHAARLK
jgi:S-formylglutathione hydrolase